MALRLTRALAFVALWGGLVGLCHQVTAFGAFL